jgi:hypothetical protein
LALTVNRTWSPADTGFSPDPRHLGVLVFEPIEVVGDRPE